MESLEQNISLVKAEIIKEFFDPFENEELKNFIILNSKFIRSKFVVLYLKTLGLNISSDIIKISFSGDMKPFIIKGLEEESCLQLILPVRTYN